MKRAISDRVVEVPFYMAIMTPKAAAKIPPAGALKELAPFPALPTALVTEATAELAWLTMLKVQTIHGQKNIGRGSGV